MHRIDVRVIGHSDNLGAALCNEPTSSIAVCSDNDPFLLIGCGTGVLSSCYKQLGKFPPVLFLPSVRLSCMSELQSVVQYEAFQKHKIKVYGTGDVLDKAVSILDEDIVGEVRDCVEFLQVEPGVGTSVTSAYHVIVQKCGSSLSGIPASYNLVMLDISQRSLLTFVTGNLSYEDPYVETFRDAPCCVVNLWKGYTTPSLLHSFQREALRIVAIGYSGKDPWPGKILAPATTLRTGDLFVVPSIVTPHTEEEFNWANRRSASGGSSGGPPPSGTSPLIAPPQMMGNGQQRRTPPPAAGHQHASTSHDIPPEFDRMPPQTSYNYRTGSNWQKATHQKGAALRSRTPPSSLANNRREGGRDYNLVQHSPTLNARYKQPTHSMQGPPPQDNPVSYQQFHALRSDSTGLHSYRAKGTLFSHPTVPPRKLYVFNNEFPTEQPTIIMLQPNMKLEALKQKISQQLSLKPMGQLYTVDVGMIRDVAQLEHCVEVIATKHAGAPFDMYRLPLHLRDMRTAAPMEAIVPMNAIL